MKAFFHQVVELMNAKPTAWGLNLKAQITNDYNSLLSIFKKNCFDRLDGYQCKQIIIGLTNFTNRLAERLFSKPITMSSQVRASDGALHDEQTITVNVQNSNDAPDYF